MVTKEKSRDEMLMALREKREKKRQKKARAKVRRRIVAAITLISVICVTLGIVYSVSAKEITITEIDEFNGLHESHKVITIGGNVEDVLNNRGLYVGEDDKLNMPPDRPVCNNDDIVLKRGKRVTIKVGDTESVATVTKADATDALVEAGYAPGMYDNITMDGNTIELVPISYVEETTQETIERGVTYINDSDLLQGREVVMDEGEDGIKEIQQKVTYSNGEEVERTILGEAVTAEPRNKVIARGIATPKPVQRQTTRASQSEVRGCADDSGGVINGYRYKKKYTMTATTYTDDPGENAGYSVTAMGNPLRYGIAAVDPNVIPLGSQVYVMAPDGSWVYGVASAEDTGGAIKGNKIDLCYPKGMAGFGKSSCIVYLLE